MKTLHLTIIVILTLVGISSTASATSGNLTSNFQPPYPNTANLTMYNPPTFPALQAVPPDLLKTLPPLEQSEHGVMAKDITCSKGLQLIFKAKDSSPACVKPDTVQKLIERGWTVNSQITYICPTTDPSKISVDFPVKLPTVLPKGYSLQGIEQNDRIQVDAYYASKPLCGQDHNFQFHDIQLLVSISKQHRPLHNLEYYQLIPQLVGSEWDIPLGPNLISELANKGITVQPLEINGYKGFGWVPLDTPVYTEQLDVIDPNGTASSLIFYNNNDQDVYSIIDFDHQSIVRLSNIARSIPP